MYAKGDESMILQFEKLRENLARAKQTIIKAGESL